MAALNNVKTNSESVGGVSPGIETSEYKQLARADIIAAVCTVLGTLAAILPAAIGAVPEGSPAAVGLGVFLVVVGAVQNVMVRLGYMKSRTVLKTEAMRGFAQGFSNTTKTPQ